MEGVARFKKDRSRLKREESLDIWDLGPLAVAVAKIVKICKCAEVKNTIFGPLVLVI
jgi:hypothetical protein